MKVEVASGDLCCPGEGSRSPRQAIDGGERAKPADVTAIGQIPNPRCGVFLILLAPIAGE